MLPVILGIGSSLSWGLSDFLGGLQSRRLPVLGVMLASQTAGLTGITLVVLVAGNSPPSVGKLAIAGAAGAAGMFGLSCFYRGLAIGKMSVVAPISSTAAVVPVVVGLAGGDSPGALALLGMCAAVAGVLLASREDGDDAPRSGVQRMSVLLALAAALGFGLFFVGMREAARADVLWALLASRVAGVAVLAGYGQATGTRPGIGRSDLPLLGLIGLLDLGANGLYALATTKGLLSVVAVVSSLYPVTTVLLARAVLGERIRRVQELGVVAALCGVALIAAG